MLLGGLGTLWMGQDASWDLKNYHWYNAYAFLNSRMQWDVAPAQLQTYLNPLLDVFYYVLFSLCQAPALGGFLLGSLHGVSFYFLLKIALEVLHMASVPLRVFAVASAMAIGITGSAVMTQLGLSSHECILAALVLAALLAALRSLKAKHPSRKTALIGLAGLLSGIAAGLKVTSAVYAIALLPALVVASGVNRRALMDALVLSCGIGTGFILTNGFWMWQLYVQFQNPFFPLFNALFRSPYWEPIPMTDYRHFPRDWLQWVFYPFYWTQRNRLVWEALFRDARLAAVMSLGILLCVRNVVGVIVRERSRGLLRMNAQIAFVFVFFCASYAIWLYMISYYRYAVPLEMLSGVLDVCLCMMILCSIPNAAALVIAIGALVLASTQYPYWERIRFKPAYLEVTGPDLPAGSLFILVGTDPVSYVIPFLRPDGRFVSVANNFMDASQNNLLLRRVQELTARHNGPIFMLSRLTGLGRKKEILRFLDLDVVENKCAKLGINIGDEIYICPLARLSR